jgi:hypothetical protein
MQTFVSRNDYLEISGLGGLRLSMLLVDSLTTLQRFRSITQMFYSPTWWRPGSPPSQRDASPLE